MDNDAFLRHIEDIYRLCEKYHTPRFSEFLDGAKQRLVIEHGIADGMLFGGYDGSERCMLGVFPEWYEKNTEDFPISVLEFKTKYDKELSHRNYLGTILSLGIKREKIGDILTHKDGCYVFLSSDIAEFVRGGISKIAGCGVSINYTDIKDVSVPEKDCEIIDAVIASMRLDAVLAAALKKSRNEAKMMVLSGKVSVNHFEMLQTDYIVKENDLLSIRGFGRISLEAVGGRTRSERLHITLKKYI